MTFKPYLPARLAALAVLACGAMTAFGDDQLRAPSGLMTQLLRRPEQTVIVERRPRFSWIVNDSREGARQAAYQIQVATNAGALDRNEPDLWDTGKRPGAASVGVAYGGKALASNSSYWWRVRTWNAKGQVSPYSAAQQFHTGDLDAARSWPSESHWRPLPGGPADAWALEDRQPMQFEMRTPVALVEKGPGHYFVDFGKAAFGVLLLTTGAARDAGVIHVYTGEKRGADDTVDQAPGGNIGHNAFTFEARASSRIHVLSPARHKGPIPLPDHLGEVFPFRYAEVVGCPGALTKDDIRQRVVVYPFDDEAASFSSSDAALNEVWDLCKYSMKATNFLGVFIDGQRERVPYEADAYINQLGYYCVDREYALARYSHEYLLYHPTWPTEWILQSPLMAWQDYLYTGHDDSLAKYYDDLQAKTLASLARADGLISTADLSPTLQKSLPDYHASPDSAERAAKVLASIHFTGALNDIVDWPKGERDNYEFTAVNTVVNAFHYKALATLADIAKALGKTPDAAKYKAAAVATRKAINSKLFDAARGLYVDGEGSSHASLHANFFALALGLVPKDKAPGVTAFVRSKGMACSVYGAQWLLDALYDYGEADYALSLMTDRSSDRSWPHMVDGVGSTVTLEAWDMKYKPNADWNHAWGAAPANIIARKLMGITPLAPGFERVRICPQPGKLDWATITVPTIRGPVKVAYRREGGARTYEIEIPANMTAELLLPKPTQEKRATPPRFQRVEVGAGKHAYSVKD